MDGDDFTDFRASLAQEVERQTENLCVPRSTRGAGTK